MTRDEALQHIKERVHTPELILHMLATAAIMEGLAARLGQDTEKWYLTGILHDIDYEETKDDHDRHSLLAAEWLQEMGVDEEIVHAVKSHNNHEGVERATLLDKALYATDPLSGLITATAYVMPPKPWPKSSPNPSKRSSRINPSPGAQTGIRFAASKS